MRKNGRLYFFGALGGLLFGYDTGVISGAILYIKEDFDLGSFLEGAVVATLLLGAMLGAAVSGRLSDRLGRRRLIMIAGILFAAGAILAAFAPTVGVLLAARFILGIAVGAAALVVPLYLSEIAPTQIRGAVSSLNQLMIVTGILVAFIVNAALASTEDWRIMVGAGVVPALLLLAGMVFMPETPRYLVHAGEEETAREVLGEMREDDEVEGELAEIKDVEEQEGKVALRELLAPWLRPALIVAIGLAVFQQLVGINTIIYYAPTTLTNVGYGNEAAIYANVVIGVVNVLMTIVAIKIVDRVGRKPMLLGGLVGMVLSLTVLGLGSILLAEPKQPSDAAAILTLICLATFIASFAVTWGPVVWVMLPEVLPLNVRGTAMGVAIFLHWTANFIVSQSFPALIEAAGPGPVFLGYAAVGVLAFIFVKSMVTETKGRSLEEIESDLQEATGVDERAATGRFARTGEAERTKDVSTPPSR